MAHTSCFISLLTVLHIRHLSSLITADTFFQSRSLVLIVEHLLPPQVSVPELQTPRFTLGVWNCLTHTSSHLRCLVMPDTYFHFWCLLLNFRLLSPLRVSVTDWRVTAEMTLVVQYTSNKRLYVVGTMVRVHGTHFTPNNFPALCLIFQV